MVLRRTLSASTAIHGRLSAVAARMSRRHPSTLSAPRICRRRESSHRQCDPRAQASPRVLAAQVRLDGKQGKRASKGVRFRQDMFYPVHTDELYCPLEPRFPSRPTSRRWLRNSILSA